MSYLMDYGPDHPPASEPAEAPLTLLQKCAVTVVLYALIWAAGALVLHALTVASGTRLDFPAAPAQGHTSEVTTTLPPLPHVAR